MIPIKLSMENFISHTKSVLDFTRFKAALIVGVHSGNPDISNGVGKCLPGKTKLWDPLNNEYVNIETFVAEKRQYTLGLVNNKIVPVKVKNWFTLGDKKVCKIELQSGGTLTTATTHPILTSSGCKKAEDIKIGDWVAEANHIKLDGKHYMSTDEAFVLGALLGDGTVTKNFKFSNIDKDIVNLFEKCLLKVVSGAKLISYDGGKNYTIINKLDKHQRRVKIKQLANYLLENNIPIDKIVSNSARFIRGDNSISFKKIIEIEQNYGLNLWQFSCDLNALSSLKSWLSSMHIYGEKSHSKHIEAMFLCLPEPQIAAILSGLWLTDGYISDVKRTTTEISYTSVSEKLAKSVRLLLLRLGVVSIIKYSNAHKAWTVSLPVNQFAQFYKKVELVGAKKDRLCKLVEKVTNRKSNPNFNLIPPDFCRIINTSLRTKKQLENHAVSRNTYLKLGDNKDIADADILWSKVKAISALSTTEKCFDIEVESDEHLYVAESFIVHNSAVFDAIRWALFSKSRFSTKEKIIKRGRSECKVEFVFSIDNDIYKIIRKLDAQSNMFDVVFCKFDGQNWVHDGLTGSTNTVTNNKIMDVVGLSHDTFINSVYFKQNDIAGFADATTSKKKDILKEILQIGIWDDYQKTAKNMEKKLIAKRDALQSRIESLGNIDEEKAKNEKEIEIKDKELSAADNVLSGVESKIVKCEEEIADLEIVLDKLGITNQKRLESKLASISSRAKEIRDRRVVLKDEVKKNNDISVSVDRECLALEHRMGELSNIALSVDRPDRDQVEKVFMKFSKERRLPSVQFSTDVLDKRKFEFNQLQRGLDLIKLQLKQLKALEPGKECPTCLFEIKNPEDVADKRNIKEKHLQHQILEKQGNVNALNDIIEKNEIALKDANEALLEMDRISLIIAKHRVSATEANRRNGEIQEELVRLAKEWGDLKSEKEQIVDLLDNVDDVDKGQKELDRIYNIKKKLFKQQEEARKTIMKISIEKGSLIGFSEELIRRASERDILIGQKDAILLDLETYTKLVRAFGKDGIQAIIMENVTEDLKEYTNTILKHICNEPMSVDFVTQKQTGSGNWKEGFDIKISIDSSVVDFDDLSGGEQVRVAFALRLALSRLLMRRIGSNIQFLLLDEIDQSLDKYGVEVLSESINALSEEFKILVITHNEFMKERFSHIISVQKGPTGSILRQ